MMKTVSVGAFLVKAEEIAAENPRYDSKGGHDGSDGYCDCIGLVIGAIRRAGGRWTGMHGSNYAARREVSLLSPIAGTGDLTVGEAVFKKREPGQKSYALPGRYGPGGGCYNGDLNDYYHVGIVESVFPLRIRHMTSPGVRMDTSLGKWACHGRLLKIDYGESGKRRQNMEKVTIRGGNPDAPVHLRSAGSKASAVLADIPQGSQADLLEGGGRWSRVSWGGKTGYVMSEFIARDGSGEPGGEMIPVRKADLEKAYDLLGGLLGLRG